MFRRAKRRVSPGGPQGIEIIGPRNLPFRAIVYFQGLDRGFVSPVFSASPSGRKSAGAKSLASIIAGDSEKGKDLSDS
jgi:hypothetical protein